MADETLTVTPEIRQRVNSAFDGFIGNASAIRAIAGRYTLRKLKEKS